MKMLPNLTITNVNFASAIAPAISGPNARLIVSRQSRAAAAAAARSRGYSLMIPARSIPRRPRRPLSSRAARAASARRSRPCTPRARLRDAAAETAITTDVSPISHAPDPVVDRDRRRARSCSRELGRDLGHQPVPPCPRRPRSRGDCTSRSRERLRVVPVNVAIAPARVVAHLVDGPVERERLVAEQERAARDGRDQRDLVAVGELPLARARTPC